MDVVALLLEKASGEGVFFLFTIILAVYFKKEMDSQKAFFIKELEDEKNESKEREGKLAVQLERSNEQLNKAIDALDKMADKYDVVIGEIRDLKDKLK